MTPEVAASLIAGGGFVVSVLTTVFISGVRWGSVETRLNLLEATVNKSATKDQLTGVEKDVAEIKGMFRMTLRKDIE